MCGIAGMFEVRIAPPWSAWHRHGPPRPDDDGFYVDDRVALGFRRLSIIDGSVTTAAIEDDRSSL
jgi:asparagine synthetase B (glutamine-hydrolysing)